MSKKAFLLSALTLFTAFSAFAEEAATPVIPTEQEETLAGCGCGGGKKKKDTVTLSCSRCGKSHLLANEEVDSVLACDCEAEEEKEVETIAPTC